MAWALRLGGGDNYLEIDIPIDLYSRATFSIITTVKASSGFSLLSDGSTGNIRQFFIGHEDVLETTFFKNSSQQVFWYRKGLTNSTDYHQVELVKKVGGEYQLYIDSAPLGVKTNTSLTTSGVTLDRIGRAYNTYYEFDIQSLVILDEEGGSELFNWDATVSDHNSGSDPVTNPFILTDTIAGNNATGVNMTTANWINLGGGGTSPPWWVFQEDIIIY